MMGVALTHLPHSLHLPDVILCFPSPPPLSPSHPGPGISHLASSRLGFPFPFIFTWARWGFESMSLILPGTSLPCLAAQPHPQISPVPLAHTLPKVHTQNHSELLLPVVCAPSPTTC